jgi:hypothetical protein
MANIENQADGSPRKPQNKKDPESKDIDLIDGGTPVIDV